MGCIKDEVGKLEEEEILHFLISGLETLCMESLLPKVLLENNNSSRRTELG
jgi:hypothetical protein